MSTYFAKKEAVERKWLHIDATGVILGKLAAKIAPILRGKHRPTYTPHVDTGDFVIITNAEKIKLTGAKEKDKVYYRHTGYPGGIKSINAGDLRLKKPDQLIRKAVQGMLPKSRLGRQVIKKLKIVVGPEHPHEAQTPETINLN